MQSDQSHFNHIVIGGTFDHLHHGHEEILRYAFRLGAKVTIGLTSDQMARKKIFSSSIQDYSTRKKTLENFLESQNLLKRSKIIKINDIFGTATSDNTIDAIVTSEETRDNALLINDKRREKGLVEMQIFSYPFVKGHDSQIIRSQRIRAGEINQDGEAYISLFELKKALKLPRSMRSTLRQPLGKVIKNDQTDATEKAIKYIKKLDPVLVITVGDIVSNNFKLAGFEPDISIIDHRTQRENIAIKILVVIQSPMIQALSMQRQ